MRHLVEQSPAGMAIVNRAGEIEYVNPALVRVYGEQLAQARGEITGVIVEPGIVDYITRIAVASRKSSDLLLGGSPRASISLLMAGKSFAAIQGRDYVVPEDVKSLVSPVYRHRVILRPEAEIEGLDADAVMARVLAHGQPSVSQYSELVTTP